MTIADAILAGDRAALARAITLMESRRPDHRLVAQDLLNALMKKTGKAIRVGISGVPGVGKSTLIDTLGTWLTEQGHKVAVLAVDPSSTKTGGAILGDKTRMARLSGNDKAFIRPSPSSGTLGGVAARTREAMLLCEAAGYDVILVETVGVGQSETAVADLTDTFVVLMLPNAGDELQGVKKGILERADIVAINKADDSPERAKAAAAEYRSALRILASSDAFWMPPVLTVSGLTGDRLDTLWQAILDHRNQLEASGHFEDKRHEQDLQWMWAMLRERIEAILSGNEDTRRQVKEIEGGVKTGAISPAAGAEAVATLLNLKS